MKNWGICHICGTETQLTYEHVPPRAAFNDKPIVLANVEKIFSTDDIADLDMPKGRKNQRGAGAYTLCSTCNNISGGWYGSDFVDWTYQGLILSEQARQAPSLYYIFRIFPLRVIKQIICMFFSANGERFQEIHQNLVRLVLNRLENGLDPQIRIYTFLNISGRFRQTGVTGIGDIFSRENKVFSEIASFPLGYVMTINSPPPDSRLVDITFFSDYRFNDWKDVSLRLPVLPVYTAFPGDYRPREDIAALLEKI